MAVRNKKKTSKATKTPKGVEVGELNGLPVWRMKVKDLKEAPYNPRMIDGKALDGLKASVTQFGLVEPVIYNRRTGHIVGGHQRVKTLDGAETDVVVVDLADGEERALNVALNNPHTAGDWTTSLGEILDELETEFPDLASSLLFDELRVDVPVDMGEFTRPEFDDILDGGEFKDTSTTKKDGNWFYIEYYGDDERFEKLRERLAPHMKSGHEVDSEIFEKFVLNHLEVSDAPAPNRRGEKKARRCATKGKKD